MTSRLALFAALSSASLFAAELQYPKVEGAGGVFEIPGDPEMPKQGSKVVVDVTSSGYEGGVNKGFDRAARFVNLLTLGGDQQFQMAIVLHGGATKEALSDEQYREQFGRANPNRSLMQKLRAAGVEILVCGQAMTHAGFDPSRKAPEVQVALSAATALINRQRDGFAYLPVN